jgi:hypothetical protein
VIAQHGPSTGPALVFLLLEEGLESVADIEHANRFRVAAEHGHVLKVQFSHSLPGGVETVLRATRDDLPAHQNRDRRLGHSHVRQMTDDVGLADDARGFSALVAYDEKSDVRPGKHDGRATHRRVKPCDRESGRDCGTQGLDLHRVFLLG